MIGWVDGGAVSYDDHDIQSVNGYYQVTAVNSMPGDETCESAPAMSSDGSHNYVHVTTDGVPEQNEGVSVSPNPTSGKLAVKAEGMTRITVLNALGQVVYDTLVEGSEATLDLTQYGAGMYMVRIETMNETIVKRVSVTR